MVLLTFWEVMDPFQDLVQGWDTHHRKLGPHKSGLQAPTSGMGQEEKRMETKRPSLGGSCKVSAAVLSLALPSPGVALPSS